MKNYKTQNPNPTKKGINWIPKGYEYEFLINAL
jgi:hypothetical protein